ncbi:MULTISPECIES: hypothetical protein [Sphingobacterium]|uniref:Cytochrome c domain-containing protein n=1 Tax=Sphingobacterium kitahiroshimense TaxID=470446 RepID=A0ABV0C1B4_9SPHI|nr:hypothetical protein [Sphingobacterium sp. IITKGP-BTPF85]KKX52201.1 hypothetical protein L950_0201485 [Sphingobacterium sp. IITKGP-BTPF85]
MKILNNIKSKGTYKLTLTLGVIGLFLTVLVSAFTSDSRSENTLERDTRVKKDSIQSVEAFKKVYAVLQSPRCVNCHPSGDIPLQGDERKLHAMFPKRGPEGKGMLTMKCNNCHQDENTAGLKTPPGSPNWHLPPEDMKMVFEGKSAYELAKQLVDRKQNGNKDLKALIAHADDGLVKWGWEPGEGRTLPPISHAAFKEAWITWLTTGAYAPTK